MERKQPLRPDLLATVDIFERETGRGIANELGPDADEAIIELFLIVNGYLPANLRPSAPLSVARGSNAKAGK